MLRVLLIHVSYFDKFEYSIKGEVLSHDRLPPTNLYNNTRMRTIALAKKEATIHDNPYGP